MQLELENKKGSIAVKNKNVKNQRNQVSLITFLIWHLICDNCLLCGGHPWTASSVLGLVLHGAALQISLNHRKSFSQIKTNCNQMMPLWRWIKTHKAGFKTSVMVIASNSEGVVSEQWSQWCFKQKKWKRSTCLFTLLIGAHNTYAIDLLCNNINVILRLVNQ